MKSLHKLHLSLSLLPPLSLNIYIYIYTYIHCSPMARETWVQSQVESYQRLKKWYLMPPCLTLSIIWYGSRVKWSNPGKGVASSPTPWCSKLSKREPSGHPRLKGDNFTYLYMYVYRVTINRFLSMTHSNQCRPSKFDLFLHQVSLNSS